MHAFGLEGGTLSKPRAHGEIANHCSTMPPQYIKFFSHFYRSWSFYWSQTLQMYNLQLRFILSCRKSTITSPITVSYTPPSKVLNKLMNLQLIKWAEVELFICSMITLSYVCCAFPQHCGLWAVTCVWESHSTPLRCVTYRVQWSVRFLHGALGDPVPLKTVRTRAPRKVNDLLLTRFAIWRNIHYRAELLSSLPSKHSSICCWSSFERLIWNICSKWFHRWHIANKSISICQESL